MAPRGLRTRRARSRSAVVGAGQAGLIVEPAPERGRPRARRPRAAVDPRRRLAGPLGRVPPRLAELDDLRARASTTAAPTPTGSCRATRSSTTSGRTRPRSRAPVELETEVTRLDAVDARRGAVPPGHAVAARSRRGTSSSPAARSRCRSCRRSRPPSIRRSGSSTPTHYRNPDALPPGGVLLVGSGQTGVQLAEELMAAGRPVTMAVGHCGRFPRRYRDRDCFWWLRQLGTRGPEVGTPLPTADGLADRAGSATPATRICPGTAAATTRTCGGWPPRGSASPAGSRAPRAASAGSPTDLGENLRFADGFFAERFRARCDTFAERAGEDLPSDEPEQFAFDPPGGPGARPRGRGHLDGALDDRLSRGVRLDRAARSWTRTACPSPTAAGRPCPG